MNRLIPAKLRWILLSLLLITVCPGAYSQQNQSSAIQLEEAQKAFDLITKANSYVEDLASASLNMLPIGLQRTVNNMEYTIAVDKVNFYPEYTEMSVFAKAVLPQSDGDGFKTLFFGAREVKMSYDGSIIGDANLTLLHDIEIPFNNGNMSIILKGDYNSKTGNSNSKTYMSIDCKGFKEMGLDADIVFPVSLMTSAEAGSPNQQVRGHFQTIVQNWNDMVVDISLPSFQLTGLDGFVFNVSDVVFDFSDSRNHESVCYPSGYQAKYMIDGAATLWRGVYAKNLTITMPTAFNDNNNRPTSFSASNLLIDDNGVTGLFEAENVLSFSSGNASGWNFSVEDFSLELEANKLKGAGFGGQIGLPISDTTKTSRLNYDAVICAGNRYIMQVSPVGAVDFSIFKAKGKIFENSYVKLEVVNGRFRPEALLHGEMYIGSAPPADAAGTTNIPKAENNADSTSTPNTNTVNTSVDNDSDIPVKIPALVFQSLALRTYDPYISVEYFGYTGKVSLGAFPISLDNIGLRCSGDRVELTTGIGVTLGDDLFAGHTRLRFMASMRDAGGRKRWRYEGTKLEEISIKASIAETLKLDGTITWHRKDPVYGDGFMGSLAIEIVPLNNLKVEMRGAFGRVDGYRYWFVDGGVELPGTGIPVVGPLTITGFSGGASQKMRGQGSRSVGGSSSFSSTTYVPDKNMGLGLKAGVLLSIAKIASGEACFDIAFNARGGLSYIGFFGYVKCSPEVAIKSKIADKYKDILDKELAFIENDPTLSKLKNLKLLEPISAAEAVSPIPASFKFGIMGTLGIQYDFANKSLHATTDVVIRSPGGFIEGVGKNGSAGYGVLHIDPSEWYLHLGDPDNRLGVKMGFGNILSIKTGQYLMVGTRIPELPAPPQEVANILGMDLSSLLLNPGLEGLSQGKGFAIGSDFQVKTGDLSFLMMYANFAAGLGFDIMLKDYSHLECKGGGQIGLDGWFAQGQAYAYLQGELGVKIRLWLIKAKFPIIKGSTAALLQASLPSPTKFKGYLGVNVNILGIIKGKLRFKLSIGDTCDPVVPGGSPLNMPMISDLSPAVDESNVSVFTMPQATFNMSIGKAMDIEDDSGVKTYRIALKTFEIIDENGSKVEGHLKWNDRKDAAMFQAKEVLPPMQKLKAVVQVTFERLEGGVWKRVYTSGEEAVETRSCEFTTGSAPSNIPIENIVYSYPVVGQDFYLPREYNKGYVQLQFGQKYLFEKGFDYTMAFRSESAQDVETDFKYDAANNRLEFSLPQLQTAHKYDIAIYYLPEEQTGAMMSNSVSNQLVDDEDGTLAMESKAAYAGVNESAETDILCYGFGTSRYETFKAKVNSIDYEGRGEVEDAGLSYRFLYKVRGDEAFDAAEVTGVDKTAGQPLIHPYAVLKEPFYTSTIEPLVYKDYPFGTIRLKNRVDTEVGVPPVKSVFIYPWYLNMLESGSYSRTFYFPYSYELGIISERDFRDLQSQVVNNRDKVDRAVYNRFVGGSLPFIKKGKYKVVLKYILPDGTQTSEQDFYFNNFLKFNE